MGRKTKDKGIHFEDLDCKKVYISATRDGYLTVNKIKAERSNIIRDTLKVLIRRIDTTQCQEIHLYMNSMFSVWACEDIAAFENRPKVILHIPDNEMKDNVPLMSLKGAYLLFDIADDVVITDTMYDGLTNEMLFITYADRAKELAEFTGRVTVDIKELIEKLYETGFSQSVYPF